jgi:hypothetical protein
MLLFFVSLCYCIQYFIPFFPLINMDQQYQSNFLFIYFSLCMSPTRYGYKKLGLKPIDPLQYRPCRARKKPMVDEKKDDGARDPFKNFLWESLAGQRNEMMDNFAYILQRLPKGDTYSTSGHVIPFKV